MKKKFEPKQPHIIRRVLQTKVQHADKQGNLKTHREKVYQADGTYRLRTVPTMLKYEHKIDRSKKYPYASKRQNTRRWGRAFGGEARLAA